MTQSLMADVIIGLSAAASVWFLAAYCWRPPSVAKTLVKTVSVAGLALAAFLIGGPLLLIVALGLGALGDFFLSRPEADAFLAGLIAFAVSHLAYIALLTAMGGVIAPSPAGAILVLLTIAMALLLFRHAGALRWPVLAYAVNIGVMGLIALGLPPQLWLATVAAICFVFSDLVLGLEVFVLPASHPLRRITPFVIWLFYWAAQFLFLAALGPYWVT